MNKLRAILFSAPAVILLTIGMATISLFTSLWDKHGGAQHRVARLWSRMLLFVGFVQCRIFGLEKLDPKRGYVLVANHASYFDTPVILSSIRLDFRFFAKKGLFQIPFLGWHLQRAGHLPVVRDDPRASIKSLTEGAKLIAERNISVLIFPEGGRSEHTLRAFKEGGAYLAIKAGVPVVPVGLIGTRNVLPMHSGIIRGGRVEVHVGDPIETAGMKLSERGKLNELLERTVAAMIGEPVPQAEEQPAD